MLEKPRRFGIALGFLCAYKRADRHGDEAIQLCLRNCHLGLWLPLKKYSHEEMRHVRYEDEARGERRPRGGIRFGTLVWWSRLKVQKRTENDKETEERERERARERERER